MEDQIRGLPMVTVRVTHEERQTLRKAAALSDKKNTPSFQEWARSTLIREAAKIIKRSRGRS